MKDRGMKDRHKELVISGIIFGVIQFLISSGIFVTYQTMATYAAPKSDISKIETTLLRIENKLDNYILKNQAYSRAN